ncbi:hypothetical protein LOAG_08640 [Loa loa]|uniref:Uncharacterized protein n=1 Tax=Loa loa TaxID=7209 RepID=A0A1S0TT75_LOALO|nr:hypothetical protein LOAG_08640 [Loa loa]EFO19853.1 hypothetical protein LOAG_08640 [Loa loa]
MPNVECQTDHHLIRCKLNFPNQKAIEFQGGGLKSTIFKLLQWNTASSVNRVFQDSVIFYTTTSENRTGYNPDYNNDSQGHTAGWRITVFPQISLYDELTTGFKRRALKRRHKGALKQNFSLSHTDHHQWTKDNAKSRIPSMPPKKLSASLLQPNLLWTFLRYYRCLSRISLLGHQRTCGGKGIALDISSFVKYSYSDNHQIPVAVCSIVE